MKQATFVGTSSLRNGRVASIWRINRLTSDVVQAASAELKEEDGWKRKNLADPWVFYKGSRRVQIMPGGLDKDFMPVWGVEQDVTTTVAIQGF